MCVQYMSRLPVLIAMMCIISEPKQRGTSRNGLGQNPHKMLGFEMPSTPPYTSGIQSDDDFVQKTHKSLGVALSMKDINRAKVEVMNGSHSKDNANGGYTYSGSKYLEIVKARVLILRSPWPQGISCSTLQSHQHCAVPLLW